MLSKSKKKFIRSLEHKKFRKEYSCFLAEGNKLVADLLPYFECKLLLVRSSWLATQGDIHAEELIIAGDGDIESTSLLKTPQDVLAVFQLPEHRIDTGSLRSKLSLVLDGIQDPGNLGTIIRLADWFGIEDVICSPDTVDAFNPKTVQATMGALARVKVHYTDLPVLISRLKDLPVYGTFLDGSSIYNKQLSAKGLIVMGNEGKGISQSVAPLVTEKLFIPNFPPERPTSESLNVGVATAIVCAAFRRQNTNPV